MSKKVYITGIGSISALGYGNEQIWDNLVNDTQTVQIKEDWANEKIQSQYFGNTPQVDTREALDWKERRLPNRYSSLGMLACKNAIEDAGLTLHKDQDNEIGLVIETCLAATESVEDYLYDLFQKGVTRVRPMKFTKTVANGVLGDISRFFKLNGPSSLLYNENSINYGYDLIQKGIADIVICGGVDHFTDFRVLCEQEKNYLVPIHKQDNISEAYQKVTDLNKNVIGDGSAFIVLESEKSAQKRKANTYAELVDYHSNFDYENVDTTTKRQAFILEDAYKKFKTTIAPNKKVAFMSAYTTNVQTIANENSVLQKVAEQNEVLLMHHKQKTGDMKSASNVMSMNISSQILKNNLFPQNGKAISEVDYAMISTTHEGGTSSHYLLKSSN